VRQASVEVVRVVEGAVGVLLLALVLSIIAVSLLRRWASRRRVRHADPGVPALARFADTEIFDSIAFGGGAGVARVQQRRDTVVYGYLAVVEEFVGVSSGATWCTLTVSLPGRVPLLVVDNVAALGRPGVPFEAPHRTRAGDPSFDASYVVGAGEPEAADRVLGPAARAVLLDEPVQRLMLHDSKMVLRTFDGVTLDRSRIESLNDMAARFLSSTPSFVRSSLAVSGPVGRDEPLPEGLYGPDVS
jgi:hypothetical protein